MGEEETEEEALLDRPLWSYVSERITRLLREGLGDRCVLARPLCGAAGEDGEDFKGEGEGFSIFNLQRTHVLDHADRPALPWQHDL